MSIVIATSNRATFEVELSRRAIFARIGRFEFDAELVTMSRLAGGPRVWREVDRAGKSASGRLGLIQWVVSSGARVG